MGNKLIKYKFRNEYFAGYGLNKFKNFLSAPECDCGCGAKATMVLKERDELFDFMAGVLIENDCDCCAVFAHTYDDNMYAAVKLGDIYEDNFDEDNLPIRFYGIDKEDLEFFQLIDAEIELHCYGLIIETKKGHWKIIKD